MPSSKPILKIDWCSHAAAKFAVINWHYSKRMPKSKLAKLGVWENERFVGAIVFGVGATPEIGKPFGLVQKEICELVRVALNPNHRSPVSKCIAIACRVLKKSMPGLKLIVSFADTSQGHHGGIYQAGGWVFVGSEEYHAYRVLGCVVHPRTLYDRYGVGGQSIPWLRKHVDPFAERVRNGIKHKYVMPLDATLMSKLKTISKPYPKRAVGVSSTPVDQTGGSGSQPTAALHSSEVPHGRETGS